jgi:hypothetical protein
MTQRRGKISSCVQAIWLCTIVVHKHCGYLQYLCTCSKHNKRKGAQNYVCDTLLCVILQRVSVFLKSYYQAI